MTRRRGGGSQTTVPSRKRKKGPDRKASAYLRAVELLGEDTIKQIKSDWDSCDTSFSGKEWQQSEGVVMQLLQQGMSERLIRAILPVGGSRISRLRTALKDGIDTFHTRREPAKPSHAFTIEDMDTFKAHCSTWVLEDGFPCAHRRPRQYFTEAKLTWKVVHDRYVDETKRANPDARTMSYSRFTQYVHNYYPGVRLTRTAEDVCDCCVRLDILLHQPELSEEDKQKIMLEKRTHLSEAIDYTALHAPNQLLPSRIIPDTFDEDTVVNHNSDEDLHSDSGDSDSGDNSAQYSRVQIQAEDYGGGISMPHYRHSRPSADYFNSNLIIQNFVVADITNNRNNVFFYDERAQGKDADALCSLRLLYHLTTVQNDARNGVRPADVSFCLLDDCVGQNKSKVVLMFSAMLSLVFPYKKVVLCFLLPGHSHNIADRVVAWCRATRGKNLYTPVDLVEEVNKVKSVNGVFNDHNDPKSPCFVGWGALLAKYFTLPPDGYTANYLFEIDQGVCTARKTVDTADEDAVTFSMVPPGNIDAVRKAVIAELFGSSIKTIWEGSIRSVQHPRHEVNELSTKKAKSLVAKYFSIRQEHLDYYPAVPDAIRNAPALNTARDQAGSTDTTTKPPKKKPGRPKRKISDLKANQPSILQFFSSA